MASDKFNEKSKIINGTLALELAVADLKRHNKALQEDQQNEKRLNEEPRTLSGYTINEASPTGQLFDGVTLHDTTFVGCDLFMCDFSGADVARLAFEGSNTKCGDLSVKGLTPDAIIKDDGGYIESLSQVTKLPIPHTKEGVVADEYDASPLG